MRLEIGKDLLRCWLAVQNLDSVDPAVRGSIPSVVPGISDSYPKTVRCFFIQTNAYKTKTGKLSKISFLRRSNLTMEEASFIKSRCRNVRANVQITSFVLRTFINLDDLNETYLKTDKIKGKTEGKFER